MHKGPHDIAEQPRGSRRSDVELIAIARGARHLRSGWRAAVGAVVLFAAANCEIDESELTVDLCHRSSDETVYDLIDLIEPVEAVDYLEIWGGVNAEPLGTLGIPCDRALDREACMESLASVERNTDFKQVIGDVGYSRGLVFTRGDEVGLIETEAALLEFLGPLDTLGDAAIVVVLRNNDHEIVCGDGLEGGDHPAGLVIYTASGAGCGLRNPYRRNLVLVRDDGSTEVLESDISGYEPRRHCRI